MGFAIAKTAENSELLLMFGFMPLAHYGAWLGALAGVLGVISVLVTIRSSGTGLGFLAFFGLLLTGIAAIGLSSFMWWWGLAPSLDIAALFQ